MFARWALLVARHRWQVILAWILLALLLRLFAPAWGQVTRDGDFAYLPAEAASIRGQQLYHAAFPDRQALSQVVIVLARSDGQFSQQDAVFARKLRQAIEDYQARAREQDSAQEPLPITDIWTCNDDVIGDTFRSRRAGLVVLNLRTELMAVENLQVLEQIRALLSGLDDQMPAGLVTGVSGSAAIGGDMLASARESIRNTEVLTVALVIAILLIVYRAPLLIFIPLAAIFVSVTVATSCVAAIAQFAALPQGDWLDFKIFKTTKIFVVVILYGAGTDYCLFLIARYKEELARGKAIEPAAADALTGVGQALAGSALTTIVGLAMMYFAEFGKFSNSGPALALCLLVALLACLTLAPALLVACGSWISWPFGPWMSNEHKRSDDSTQTAVGANSDQHESRDTGHSQNPEANFSNQQSAPARWLWRTVAAATLARPGLILLVSIALLSPLALHGWPAQDHITYDLLAEMDPGRMSVQGTELLGQHFSAGETGPVRIIVHHPKLDSTSAEGKDAVAALTRQLYELPGVVNVRSATQPLGVGSFNFFRLEGLRKLMASGHSLARRAYIAQEEPYRYHATRLDVVLGSKATQEPRWNGNPFSSEAMQRLEEMEELLRQADAAPVWQDARFEVTGTTAGIRDLRRVTESDRRRIQWLVAVAVGIVLLAIVRRPLVCVYLILSVLLSYLVTIGATDYFFQWHYGAQYAGLDWKVPIFLFVILIAVGQDYNIYLVTRVFEEQQRRGLREGLREAIIRTGGIITSCGLIMAGTFVSMMSGSLNAMQELGFALSLGVLLDTFVVRTVLVPAFLAIYARWQQHPAGAHASSREAAP